jgi:hypothetical protein
MKLQFLNVRKLSIPSKIISLHKLVEKEKPEVLLVQETMCMGDFIVGSVKKLFSNWGFLWMDSNGMLGGLLTRWGLFDPKPDELFLYEFRIVHGV